MKKYICEVPGWSDVTYEIEAETRGKALAKYWKLAKEAGYYLPFTSLLAKVKP